MKLSAELLEQFSKILEKYDLAELTYEEEELQLNIVRKRETQVSFPPQMITAAAPNMLPQQISMAPVAEKAVETKTDETLELVKSPIVGTAYLSSEPGAPAFIKIGDHVKKDQPIIIIEAMKVMNQLKAPVSGIIKEILTTNAKPVEFGEVLIKIQKD